MFKTKQRQNAETTEQDAPAEVNDQSAAVSEEAACCVADIDDVLTEVDEALSPEDEERTARAESAELWATYLREEITEGEYWKQRDVLIAKYAHLNLGNCWC